LLIALVLSIALHRFQQRQKDTEVQPIVIDAATLTTPIASPEIQRQLELVAASVSQCPVCENDIGEPASDQGNDPMRSPTSPQAQDQPDVKLAT
jgi:hypothetical protein